MEWLRELRIAVIEKNIEKVDALTFELPHFETLQDKKDALFLLKEALDILQNAKEDTKKVLSQLRKNIDFLNSTRYSKSSSIDVRT